MSNPITFEMDAEHYEAVHRPGGTDIYEAGEAEPFLMLDFHAEVLHLEGVISSYKQGFNRGVLYGKAQVATEFRKLIGAAASPR